jgi:hypothetical protein
MLSRLLICEHLAGFLLFTRGVFLSTLNCVSADNIVMSKICCAAEVLKDPLLTDFLLVALACRTRKARPMY